MIEPDRIQRHAAQIREAGYTVLDDAVEPNAIARLVSALDAIEREHRHGFAKTTFEGLNTVRINNLLAHGDVFWQVPLHAAALAIAEQVLDKELLLSSFCSLTLGPGQTAQPLHEDTQQIPLSRPHPPLAVNAIWALSDFTTANGATLVVPGSHKFPSSPKYGKSYGPADGVTAMTMKAGSILLFDSALWHAGGANTSSARRYALSCYYGAGWLRQQENLQLGIPQETARRFPRRLQEMCGYSIYRGQWGHIDNRDPITLLGQSNGRPTVWEATDRKPRCRTGPERNGAAPSSYSM
jgi:ectoine hydroxylase-related dioxygenase (phytanoyl-CoA dioxygenase family)